MEINYSTITSRLKHTLLLIAGICVLLGTTVADAQAPPTAPGNTNLVAGPVIYTGNAAISWDQFFTDKTYWDKPDLPVGIWYLESHTDTVIKSSITDTQTFMGVKPLRVRVRISTKTGKVISAEMLWAQQRLLDGKEKPKLERLKGPSDVRKLLKLTENNNKQDFKKHLKN